MAWSIALFMGLQSMAFFSTITWLPEILVDDGFSEGYAGALSGITQLVQIAPAFAIPVLAARRASQLELLADHRRHGVRRPARRAGGAGRSRCCGWSSSASARAARSGSGLILPVLRGRDPGQVAGMVAMSMGVGYLIAAGGPGDRRRRASTSRGLDVADRSCCW